jgi:hypothetical protein
MVHGFVIEKCRRQKSKVCDEKCVWTEEPNKRGETFALALEIRSELKCVLKDKHHS